jgi:hypothetical protein
MARLPGFRILKTQQLALGGAGWQTSNLGKRVHADGIGWQRELQPNRSQMSPQKAATIQ